MKKADILSAALVLLLLFAWSDKGEADHHEVWVANKGTDKVQILDPDSLKVKAEIPVGKAPQNISFSPDFKRAYVANGGSNNVTVIDTASRSVMATIPVGKSANHVAASPDGKILYVSNLGDNSVSVIDAESRKPVKTIPVGKAPAMALFTPDGKKAYVSSGGDGTVSVIDVAQGQVAKTVQGVGRGAMGLLLVGEKLFVTAGGDNKVAVIDTKKDEVAKEITTGKGPYGISLTGFGGVLVVANRLSNDMSVIDWDELEVVGSIAAVESPNMVDRSPKGNNVFITQGGKEPGVAVVDPFKYEVILRVKLAGDPHGIAVKR